MKRINRVRTLLILSAFILLLVCAGCDRGSVFNSSTPQATTDYTSRIESAGFDMRVYEFTPQTAQHMQCVFVAGTKKGGLFCFEKAN